MTERQLKKFTFSLQTELRFSGVLSLSVDQANAWAKLELSGVEALPMGAIEGVGNSEDPREKVEMVFLSFRQVLVSAVGGGGGTFSVVPSQEGDELGF